MIILLVQTDAEIKDLVKYLSALMKFVLIPKPPALMPTKPKL